MFISEAPGFMFSELFGKAVVAGTKNWRPMSMVPVRPMECGPILVPWLYLVETGPWFCLWNRNDSRQAF